MIRQLNKQTTIWFKKIHYMWMEVLYEIFPQVIINKFH